MTTKNWFNINETSRNSPSISIFKKRILAFIRPAPRGTFKICNTDGLRHLIRLRVGLSHLNAHKFNHGFNDTLNPLCSCALAVEDNQHFLLHCRHFTNHRLKLIDKVKAIYPQFTSLSDLMRVDTLLFGSNSLSNLNNKFLLEASIEFIISTGRFSDPLIC